MDGKMLSQLTLGDLRRECMDQLISTSGTKPNLEIRLVNYLREIRNLREFCQLRTS